MARCSAFVLRLLCESVLLVMNHLTVLTPISAWLFEYGNAMEDNRCTPHSLRNCCVVAAVNSGLPSVAHSSEMPNVTNESHRHLISPFEPSCHYDIKRRETSKELFRVYSETRSKKDWTLANIQ